MKSNRCACGVSFKSHPRRSKRNQLPGCGTNRWGWPTKTSSKRRAKYRREKEAIDGTR